MSGEHTTNGARHHRPSGPSPNLNVVCDTHHKRTATLRRTSLSKEHLRRMKCQARPLPWVHGENVRPRLFPVSCPTLDAVFVFSAGSRTKCPLVCEFCRIFFTDIICQFRDIRAMRHAGCWTSPHKLFSRLGGRNTDRPHLSGTVPSLILRPFCSLGPSLRHLLAFHLVHKTAR